MQSHSAAVIAGRTGGGLSDAVFDRAAQRPGFVQLSRRVGDRWIDMTAGQFAEAVMDLSRGLLARDIATGDRVGILSANRYEWTLFDYALWTIGAIPVPLHHTSSSEQIERALSETRAVACVIENEEHKEKVDAETHLLPALRDIWQLDKGIVDLLVHEGRRVDARQVEERRDSVGPNTPATIVYTAGTTGAPKECLITHGNLAAQADAFMHHTQATIRASPRGRTASTLLSLPLSQVYGRTAQICAVRHGVQLAHSSSMKPSTLLDDLRSFRPTLLLAVPEFYEGIFHAAQLAAAERNREKSFLRAVRTAREYALAHEGHIFGDGPRPSARLRLRRAFYDLLVYRKIRRSFGGRVRNSISGGSSLRRDIGLFFFGSGIAVHEGYGLTESSAGITCNPPGRIKFGTVGQAIDGVDIRIAQDGEIMLRGPQISPGSLVDSSPEPGAREDGWLRTGDLGRSDGDGYLYITGRKKTVIVTSGAVRVSPEPLEERVRAHAFIAQCLLVGQGRPYLTALITLDWQVVEHLFSFTRLERSDLVRTHVIRQEIQRAVDRANATVPGSEAIQDFRILSDTFTVRNGTLTSGQRVRRAEAEAEYRGVIDAMYGTADVTTGRAVRTHG
ncbi:long-chain fatty acid--CoA ligase [Streptomyces sp. NBC_00878]|uniref:AMP-dependent synthetase/ligase n=1 Tax=Streptomyces sp. NBC_00878 TaxID=2975854 RepID=UPI00225AB2A2|nr:AMP-dependent synthetase/ligase [Streptomyces sp. NBC_00878]MCX4904377.1 AMP-dependent synthetase/ligase [Streptomyces sp. NBC_00878]